jgi:hypothetical protein
MTAHILKHCDFCVFRTRYVLNTTFPYLVLDHSICDRIITVIIRYVIDARINNGTFIFINNTNAWCFWILFFCAFQIYVFYKKCLTTFSVF